jgi:adiponectin receptor
VSRLEEQKKVKIGGGTQTRIIEKVYDPSVWITTAQDPTCNKKMTHGNPRLRPRARHATRIKTVAYHEAPEYLRDNEYLVHGYRPTLSFSDCFHSIFYKTNETFNIHTHLWGAVIFGALTCYALFFHTWPHDHIEHRIVFAIFLGCAALCCAFSTAFHVWGAMSERVNFQLLKFDYTGISLLISASILIVVYYLFYCNPFWRTIYCSQIALIMTAGVGFSSWDRFYAVDFRKGRALLFTSMAASGIVPAIHFSVAVGMHDIHQVGAIVPFVLMMMTYLVGVIIYASRVPERWRPGYFDTCFHSHTYMHVCVLVAACFHLIGSVRLYEYMGNRDQFSCSKSAWEEYAVESHAFSMQN